MAGDWVCERETSTEGRDTAADEFSRNFDDPLDAFDGYTESIDGERELVLRFGRESPASRVRSMAHGAYTVAN